MKQKSPYKRRPRRLTSGRLLKWSRVVVSLVMLALTTALATSLSARVALSLGWVARLQIVPLALAGATAGFAAWLAVAIVFGRAYCSWVCPMGTFQDIAAHWHHQSVRRRYIFRQPHTALRYTTLITVMIAAAAGIVLPLIILDPYSAWMRICSEMLRPVAQWFGGETVMVASWWAFAVAAVTFVGIGFMAWWRGRLWCNTMCPVGSLLSCFSRYSLFHFDIDTDVCINCRQCERRCKASCIDTKDHVVDGSRCVMCFNCVDVCDAGAIRYTTRRKKLSIPMMQRVKDVALNAEASAPDTNTQVTDTASDKCSEAASQPRKISRRQFMATGMIVAAATTLEAVNLPGGRKIKPIKLKQEPLPTSRPVLPPGHRSTEDFSHRCTACGLCVANCPNRVLRPAKTQLGILHTLQPIMAYDSSYCLYNCTVCSRLCPTGALRPLSEEEKHISIIGCAFVEPSNCIGCGQCARRCPRKAIAMVARPADTPGPSRMIPHVDLDLCIGCGACQYICPATPQKAIGVNGQ